MDQHAPGSLEGSSWQDHEQEGQFHFGQNAPKITTCTILCSTQTASTRVFSILQPHSSTPDHGVRPPTVCPWTLSVQAQILGSTSLSILQVKVFPFCFVYSCSFIFAAKQPPKATSLHDLPACQAEKARRTNYHRDSQIPCGSLHEH